MTSILAFSGSNRKGAYNQMAVNALAGSLDQVTHLDLGSLELPIYNADEEAADGLPAGAAKLRTLLSEHEAWIIGCPEYNGFMTPLLMNAINWGTRSPGGVPDLSCFQNKVVLIASTSPGALGGLRAATHLKTMLSGIGAFVLPDTFTVPDCGR